MAWSTRFATARLLGMLDGVDQALTAGAQQKYQVAADEAAESWSNKIRSSGRAAGHGMENVRAAVTQPRKGGFFVRMGWLDHPPMAADGRTSWFVYQDTGYDPFGMIAKGYNATRVPGLFLQLDARTRLTEKLHDANEQIANDVRSRIRRGR